MKNIPIFRGIAVLIAVGLLIFAFFSLKDGYLICHNFDDWLTVKPMNIKVDLSKKRVFRGKFEQTCSIAHGESLYLKLPQGKYNEDFIRALKFHFEIINEDGKAIIDKTSANILIDTNKPDQAITLLGLPPFAKGQYEFTLNIITPVPELAEINQQIFAKYHLCGLELLIGKILLAIGAVSFIIASVIILLVIKITRKKKSRSESSENV